MKKLSLIIAILGLLTGLKAQQLPQYTQYFLNDYVLNPAVAGSKDYWTGRVNSRLQWVGITDAPRTHVVSVNGALENRKMGLGGYMFSDVVGHTHRTGFSGSYAYHFNLSSDIRLGLGINAGLLQFAIDGSQITFDDPGDQALSNSMMSVVTFDAGAGLYLYSDEFWFSFSAPQLIGNELQFFDNYDATLSSLARHYFMGGGYKFELMDDIYMEPSIFMRYVDPVPIQYDVSLRFLYQERFWLGGSYRLDAAVSMMAGFTLPNNMTFGYSYDIPTNNIKNYATGSHEIMLGLRFADRARSTKK